MNTTITNNGLPKFTQTTGNTVNDPATTVSAPAGNGQGGVSRAGDDQLKLTDSALALQQAARSDDSSAIDPQRVEQVRKALADGSYRIDPARIADRMLALEQQIGGTGKA